MSTDHRVLLLRSDSKNPAFQKFIIQLDQDLREKYGDIQSIYDRLNQVSGLNTVIVAYIGEEAVGCGCFKPFSDNTIEIKRMFVRPDQRGQGIATHILNELELWAQELGYAYAILETGKKQPESINLYVHSGYAITINYGPYALMDHSVCMRKKL